MKRYIRSATQKTKKISIGMWLKQYLEKNHGYRTFDNWTYFGRAHQQSRRIAKLMYVRIPYQDIDNAVNQAIQSSPLLVRYLDEHSWRTIIDVFDEKEEATQSSIEEYGDIVLVQVYPNSSIIVDTNSLEILEIVK